MSMIPYDAWLDAKGVACPMPIVRAKKAMKELEPGHVLMIEATDQGSTADLKAWAESAGHQYLGTVEEGEMLRHFMRKCSVPEAGERRYERVADNGELERKLEAGEPIVVLDVREAAEYAFKHIPGAVSIPLGELDKRMAELDSAAPIYVVCRTGTRSDLAASMLAAVGFGNVKNVVPGMSGWTGRTEGMNA